MKSNWYETTLGTCVRFQNGKKRPVEGGVIPVYGGNGVLDHTNRSNNRNCVIIGRVGAYCGSVFREKGICWVSDNAISATMKSDVDIDYIYYFLKNAGLNRRHIGTSQPLLTQEILNSISIYLPSLPTQKKIAAILSALDEKIATNRAINDNLQQQAKALYQQMFIDNPVPGGCIGTLSDIADITMGQSPNGSSYNEDGNGTVFFQGRAEFGFRFPSVRLYTTEPKRMACANDTLMSVRAPVGDLNVAYTDCCIGRGLAAIHSKSNQQSFILYTMFSLRKQLEVFNGEGTVFGSINRTSLNELPIFIPSDREIVKFEAIVAPIDAAIRNNYEEICRLEKIRDTLLPKLMSGELDVSAVEL